MLTSNGSLVSLAGDVCRRLARRERISRSYSASDEAGGGGRRENVEKSGIVKAMCLLVAREDKRVKYGSGCAEVRGGVDCKGR
jgi:hypothetical protein